MAAADIHGRHDVYAWLVDVARARQPLAVILAGDPFGYPDGFETVETAQEAERHQVLAELERPTQPVLNIMGNGDWVDLHGELPHERPESAIASDLAKLESLVDSRTVLVTHGPAFGAHVHSQFGRVGRHFSVASGGKKHAMLIDLETMEHEVVTG